MASRYDPVRDCQPPADDDDDEAGLQSPDMGSPVALPAAAAPSFLPPRPQPLPPAPVQAPPANPLVSPPADGSSLPARPSSASSSASSSFSSAVPPHASSSSSRRTPYAPVRVTPPGSVLRPLPWAEYERLRRDPGAGSRNALRGWERAGARDASAAAGEGEDGASLKRSREVGDGGRADSGPKEDKRQRLDESGRPGVPKLGEDVKAIASHYNHRPEYGKDNRRLSPIFGLKAFNNWIKSVLIGKFAPLAITGKMGDGSNVGQGGRGQRKPPPMGSVLDLGCGKGGDLNKWNAARVARYTGLDLAEVSISQAVARAEDMRGLCFDFEFHALDCFSRPIEDRISPERLDSRPFDVVTMQFCMHYAFETESKARQMLANVSRGLKDGGVFIGTTTNAEKLVDQVLALPADAEQLAFGNEVYSIVFDDRAAFAPFGHRYEFYLQDAVEDVPEYLVDWGVFTSLAAEYGLHVVYKKEFHAVFHEEQDRPEFKELLTRMRVLNDRGESEMNEDQWEAANLYLAFALEKRSA